MTDQQPTWAEVTASECTSVAREKWGRAWYRLTPEHQESAVMLEVVHRLLKRRYEIASRTDVFHADFSELLDVLRPSIAAIHGHELDSKTYDPWPAFRP